MTEGFIPRMPWGLLGAERKAMGNGRWGEGVGYFFGFHTYSTSGQVKMIPLPPSNLSCLPSPHFLNFSSLFFPSSPFLLQLSPFCFTE